ncbi:hypothetical protein Mspyr1_20320 [Mycolicibacterium gilvum Spyr1]|uniref:Uncharacterized protein n=2 Tax=Mycolicibacterium gilvum TaxID=1804 RepID=E6TDP5_MYCSR|nr:hypothetical protein Mspyr1_20320 [Mycolicibacterium gilvum Spyr1]
MMVVMARSKGRKKTSGGKAWRAGREISSSDQGGVGDAGFDGDSARRLYSDDKLGSLLIRRGWVPVHIHFEDLSDMWVWPPSTPGDEGWVPTMITVQEDGYIMQSADYAERQVDHALHYDARAEVLADIESIEAYRHPSDSRTP